MPAARVFALSARDALAARVNGDAAALERSGLPALESALATELLPRQRELLARATVLALQRLRHGASRRLGERRRHNAEQMLELRGLRGKSGAKVRSMMQRLDAEMGDFERCTARLSALRAVHQRQLQKAMTALSSDVLRDGSGGHAHGHRRDAAEPGRTQGLRAAVRTPARGAGRARATSPKRSSRCSAPATSS